MRIHHVHAHEWKRSKALRLRALCEDPHGFSSTYERELALSALAMDVDEVIKPLADIRGS